MTRPITTRPLFAALEEAGIVRKEDRVNRVVIDIKVNEVPVIHIQRYGDSRLLDVVPTLTGVEIRRDEPSDS